MRALIEAADASRVVLVPNAELAAGLLDAIEREHRNAGREVWPTPQVRDFAGWLKDRHARRQLLDSSLARCLTEVEERELWRRVVLDSEPGRGFLEPSGAAHGARRARRALAEHAIPPRELESDGSEETTLFLDWNRRFDERCRELRCISADRLLAEPQDPAARERVEAASLTWIDSPLWRPAARGWLERHAGLPLAPLPAANGARTVRIVKTCSPVEELAAMAAWAQTERARNGEFRAWICVPDLSSRRAELVDAFDAALAPHRFSLHEVAARAPYAAAGGTPLADYAPVRCALELLSAAHGVIPFTRFSLLLRAPELSASFEEASSAARLDLALRSRAPSEASLAAWLTLGERVAEIERLPVPPALRRLERASRELPSFGGSHAISHWLPGWVRAFEAGPWNLRHRWSSMEYQSAERFRELLATLGTGDHLFGSHSRTAAEGILRRAARDTAFQAQTGVPPIWVSAQLSDPWLAYDGIWIAGCDESRWPAPVDPLPFLPIRLQRRYGVVSAAAESQLRLARDLQRRWIERSGQCLFSCADPDAAHRARPSPLLMELAAQDPVQADPAPHWLAQLEHAPALEALSDEWAPPLRAEERARGVSTLKSQSNCAFRAFAETRLAALALEQPVPGFNERERGEIVHDALQRIWTALGTSARLADRALCPEDLIRLVSDSAHRSIEKMATRRDPGRRWREREQQRLQPLLSSWLELELQRSPFEVERLDEGAETARHAGVDFTVRIDRIDRLADGSRVLIDYKTGSPQRDWRGDRPDNPQLPIYALLHRESLIAVAYGRVNAAKCEFVVESQSTGILPGARASTLEGAGSFAALMELWSERIERLASEFAAGRAAVDPKPTACRRCHLHGLCRVPSTLDASEAAGDPAESS